jgi:AcrR family transcriptional regulator
MADARERRRAKARLDIARVAVKLFQEHGYEATTVDAIAEAADYSVRSFYRYFTSKEDVVFFDIGFLLADVREAVAASPGARGAELWALLRDNLVASIDRFGASDPEFATSVLRLWMTDPALAGPFMRFCGRWHELLARSWSDAHGAVDAVADPQTDPEADLDAQLVAHQLVGTCEACIRVHVHTGRDLHQLLVDAYHRLESGLPGQCC